MKVKTLIKLFDKAKEKKRSIIVLGNYGIGKSAIVYSFAEQYAKKNNKELVIWHQLSEGEKKKILDEKDVSKYFFLVDIKLQTIGDISKLTGIPIIINGNGNEHKVFWELPSFLKILSRKDADGILFLDEINMASVSLQSTAFELLLQRKVGEWKLSDNVLIVGAGNPTEYNIASNLIPKPLINRCLFVKFDGTDVDEWIEWAVKNNFDERIVSFVKMFKELIKDAEDEFEQTTRPRSFELLSDMIKDENDIEFIESVAYATLHKETAIKFIQFLKLMSKLDYKQYINEPTKFDKEETQVKYAIITLIARNISDIAVDKLNNFIMHISKDNAEFSLLLLTLIKNNKKILDKILEKMPKDLIDRFIKILS